ncbi:MAG: hypothetical protein ACOCYW_08555, partial [Roseicyclus sp.]
MEQFIPHAAVTHLRRRRLEAVHDVAVGSHATCVFMPKYQAWPFLVDDISGSRPGLVFRRGGRVDDLAQAHSNA